MVDNPIAAKRVAKAEQAAASVNTFKAVALEGHAMKEKGCAANTSKKRLTQLENYIFPVIGSRLVADVKPPERQPSIPARSGLGGWSAWQQVAYCYFNQLILGSLL